MAKNTAKKIEDNAAGFATDVKKYAHQIWLAGLGAYAKAGKEGAERKRQPQHVGAGDTWHDRMR